jgi:hypothetical protein
MSVVQHRRKTVDWQWVEDISLRSLGGDDNIKGDRKNVQIGDNELHNNRTNYSGFTKTDSARH